MDISIRTDAEGMNHWAGIMQHGVVVESPVGGTVRYVLETGFDFAHGYVEDRIKTVFIDGMPVDNIDTAVVHDGARMGLAAALPGAAGIAMRRNSPYAALRGDITRGAEAEEEIVPGHITLLLFNLIMVEKGAQFLSQGVQTTGYRFGRMLAEHPATAALLADAPSVAAENCKRQELLDWAQKNPEASIRLRVAIAE
ncbi:hypothetical protein [Desulfovibrio psychrotolerans]|uniref:Uncharacterized protein n=1 Tax=Desulfovibrio psychrotolerans TaxID=415242 RepID=A0A7J0BRP0_9BACT|nr:hypothetical protein [Desulfovibrio psychrotolerans]GFM35805.1 hypothetical protein DSM19430T_04890 [Desulfovibrio psychrotolerans]